MIYILLAMALGLAIGYWGATLRAEQEIKYLRARIERLQEGVPLTMRGMKEKYRAFDKYYERAKKENE